MSQQDGAAPDTDSPDTVDAATAGSDAVAANADRTDAVAPEAYRAVMRRWPSGVTIVTMCDGEQRHGMTASAFTSVSLSPPMILIVVDQRWQSHALIAAGGQFCVNILAANQSQWSDRFAGRHGEMPDRFVDVPHSVAATGAPVLDDALAWLDCVVAQQHAAGDHTVFIAKVVAAGVGPSDQGPLLYHDGDYRGVRDLPSG